MIILGLLVVFPQSLELKDFIVKDIIESFQNQKNNVKRTVSSKLKTVGDTTSEVKTNFLRKFTGRRIRVEELEKVLSRYFQERLIKLECIGNYRKFYLIKNDSEVEPKSVLITFKAKVSIENIERTVAGKIKVVAVSTSGMWSSPHIGYVNTLKDWHFLKSSEKANQYCEGENIFPHNKVAPYKFFKMNDLFGGAASRHFYIEFKKNREMCNIGKQKYCQYNSDYKRIKEIYKLSKNYNEQLLNEKKVDEIIKGFAKRYYVRLCEKGATFACAQLDLIKKDLWKNHPIY